MFALLVTAAASLVFTFTSSAHDTLQLEREAVARRWAPLVWLHPSETFYPSSVLYFLNHVTPSKEVSESRVQAMDGESQVLVPVLPAGHHSRDSKLLASHDFDCTHCPLPRFLHGKRPSKQYSPPVYATIHTCSQPKAARGGRNIHGFPPDDNGRISISETYRLTEEEGREITSSSTISHETPIITFLNPNITPPLTTTLSPFNQTFTTQNNTEVYSHPSILSSSFSQTHTTQNNPQMYFHLTIAGTTDTSKPLSHSHALTSTIPSITIFNSTLPTANLTNYSNIDKENGTTIQNGKQTTDTVQSPNPIVISNGSRESYDPQLSYTEQSTTVTPQPMRNGLTDRENNTQSSPLREIQYTTKEINSSNDQVTTSNPRPTGQHHNNKRNIGRHTTRNILPPNEQQFTVSYWMFYPYNNGKKICTLNLGYFFGYVPKPRDNGACLGEELTMGNHVGDWEHISIQFQGSKPKQMYVSTHTFGAFYTYDSHHHRFVYASQDTREGFPLSPVYPQTIQFKGAHPILYSARGSHGLWGAPGIHQYNSFPLLRDAAGKGLPWQTWTNLKILDMEDQSTMEPHRHWWWYEGRWGNPSSKCHTLLAGMCEHAKGPTGIRRKRINFPC